jgi:hypothetical protein
VTGSSELYIIDFTRISVGKGVDPSNSRNILEPKSIDRFAPLSGNRKLITFQIFDTVIMTKTAITVSAIPNKGWAEYEIPIVKRMK